MALERVVRCGHEHPQRGHRGAFMIARLACPTSPHLSIIPTRHLPCTQPQTSAPLIQTWIHRDTRLRLPRFSASGVHTQWEVSTRWPLTPGQPPLSLDTGCPPARPPPLPQPHAMSAPLLLPTRLFPKWPRHKRHTHYGSPPLAGGTCPVPSPVSRLHQKHCLLSDQQVRCALLMPRLNWNFQKVDICV